LPTMTRWWSRLRPDNFTIALLCTVGLASLLPMKGAAAIVLDDVTTVAIAALFFLHGARLPRESIIGGMLHWRLHLTILACTFILFPLLGLMFKPLSGWLLT
ncbi:bile acid:sodium symporter, partial [Enterobacter hormaechei]|uniref:bile acid:sodium symporter n=1 Tax=Enterobacter hormaechei TaxID=158836 RepID=UPI00203CF8D0